MGGTKKSSCNGIVFLVSCLALWTVMAAAEVQKHVFVLGSTRVTRLCKTQNVITVNGQFPGPTLEVRNGDTLEVLVKNNAKYNATVHWHGVRQFRTGWADGPEFITQCPIRPGGSYTYRFTIQGQEGTLWWHAHSSWLRATVHGALIIYPSRTTDYPFRKPVGETPIVLGEWWNADPIDVINAASRTGAAPNTSDAFTINGQPGDLYPCSSNGTFKLQVRQGEMHMLRVINAAVATELFFAVADHTLTVIATDANYAKPFKTNVVLLGPGQTSDVLITADQSPSNRYYMSARAYSAGQGVPFDNTTTTAILEYIPSRSTTSTPKSPALPAFNDTGAFTQFSQGIRSLASAAHPSHVPKILDEDLFYTVGLGILPCPKGRTCGAPNNTIFAASMNNVSFVLPSTLSILQAHTQGVKGVFTAGFPDAPAKVFDYTGQNIRRSLFAPLKDTKVKILKYNASVQVVLQRTNIFAGESHPIHLHGYDFFIVGSGFGNFNAKKDPKNFNLVDPPMRNTVNVPKNGWAAIRFYADNPGAWLMHCHLDQHLGWGLATVFVVENGQGEMLSIEPPPQDLPAC